jgi:acetyl esterase/lipase
MLPAAYDDAWAALNWAVSSVDPWLSDHSDRDCVFVVGVSAGANIAHNMAIAAGVSELPAPARIEGVILLHPSFASEDKMEAEDEEFDRANKIRWAAILPDAKDGLQDPRINPMADGAPSLAKLAGERRCWSAPHQRTRGRCRGGHTATPCVPADGKGGWTGSSQTVSVTGSSSPTPFAARQLG